MKGQRAGYIRVSSEDQNTDRQLEGVDLDEWRQSRSSALHRTPFGFRVGGLWGCSGIGKKPDPD